MNDFNIWHLVSISFLTMGLHGIQHIDDDLGATIFSMIVNFSITIILVIIAERKRNKE